MIPEEEHELLVLTFLQAMAFGNEGQIGTGYLLLYHGLAHTKRQHTEWAPALLSQWSRILLWYREQFPTDWPVLAV